jgi:hypothetical protein
MNADQEKELMKMWQESVLPAPMGTGQMDARQLAMAIAKRVETFDRKIFWRNMREYVAGGALIAWFLWMLRYPGHRYLSAAGIVAVSFVMGYLWLSQRKKQPLDPSADVRSYQTALLERYDRQIELLRRVKYWYVAPLYAWMLLVLFTVPSTNVRRLPYFIGFTAFSASIVWLNEGYAVRKLRKARRDAESLME